MASASGKMLSAEERRRQKELEEARKAGLAAPEVDEDGNAINPHIPQFMASAPWYLNGDGPSLRHQRNWKERIGDEGGWYDRGATTGRATIYRKGACANCGSATHTTKDCTERPRARGAKWTGRGIAPDEKISDVHLRSFDAKRDRWNGFGAADWERVAGKAERVAAMREARARERALKEEGEAAAVAAAEAGEGDPEERVDDAAEGNFARVEKRVRTIGGGSTGSVRNLRIREDTAKYLLNLDPNSAYYDPKSRSMREDPLAGTAGAGSGALALRGGSARAPIAFAGDNASRGTGDAAEAARVAAFAATAFEAGGDVHANAAPSAAEAAYARSRQRAAAAAAEEAAAVRQAYGDAAAPRDDPLRAVAASVAYAEYDQSGRLLRGAAPKATSSRYEEDVHPGNHTSVFGSWWHDGKWGYACCHATERGAYCTGEAGKRAADENARDLEARTRAAEEARAETARLAIGAALVAREGATEPAADPASAQLWGAEAVGQDAMLDEAKLREAVLAARKHARADGGPAEDDLRGERRRGVAAATDREDGIVTAEDIEAYRLVRSRGDDPLEDIRKKKAEADDGGKDGGYGYV